MRHNLLQSLALSASVGTTLLLAGCSADPLMPDKSEEYSREFIKNFGIFDQTHDWNHASKASVTVTTSAATDIKVCAKFDGVLYSFGEFKDVAGRQTLDVDIPKGTTELIVRANGVNYPVKAGGEVSLGKSRTASRLMTEPGTDGILTWTHSRNRMLSTQALNQYIEIYPERNPNLDKGTSSFYFIADGEEHTFYPFYWNTAAKHVLGIYYIPDDNNPDEIVMQDLYFTKSKELKNSIQPNCNPEISEIQYGVGDVHLFSDYRYTCDNWNDVFPGIHFADSSLDGSQFDQLKDSEDNIMFPNGTYKLYTEDDALLKTDNGYISRISYSNYAFTLTETVTKSYYSTFTAEEKGFDYVNSSTGAAYENADYVTTKGITYKLAKGIKYGFYIKVNKGGSENPFFTTDNENNQIAKPLEEQEYDFIIFSQATRNATYVDTKMRTDNPDLDVNSVIRGSTWDTHSWWNDDDFTEFDKYSYASWGTVKMGGKDYAMFGFEDWDANSNISEGPDLNDLMFLFETGTTPSNVIDEDDPEPEPEPEPWHWIIACEDLGSNDFDFNDVVFSVSDLVEKDGKKTVKVTALASGGTLPVYLIYNGKEIVPDGGTDAEFHKWFGDGYPSTEVINAKSTRATGKSATIEVDDNFTMECCTTVKGDGTTGNMGGFQVRVHHVDETVQIQATNPNITSTIGEAPQMICVPGTWKWPKESVHITTVYSRFTEWCEKQYEATLDWHETRGNGYWQ